MSLSGITLIKNGEKLLYPYKECIRHLSILCDEVIVNVGIGIDSTHEEVQALAEELGNVRLYTHNWNEFNRHGGSELAIQANNLLPYVYTDWICYLQADELIGEWEKDYIRRELQNMPKEISQVELLRTYFYGDLQTRLVKDEIFLGRIFRTGTHIIGGDGMFLIRNSGECIRWSDKLIYHYSRMGTSQDITKRLRTLDHMFHPEEEVNTYPPFDYNLDSQELIQYNGPHPSGISDFYKGK